MIFAEIKEMYSKRSKLFHGRYDIDAYYEGRFVTDEEAEKWASIIRRGILKFLVLYLRGSNSHDEILKQLNESALDATVAETIRNNSDLDKFLDEALERLNVG